MMTPSSLPQQEQTHSPTDEPSLGSSYPSLTPSTNLDIIPTSDPTDHTEVVDYPSSSPTTATEMPSTAQLSKPSTRPSQQPSQQPSLLPATQPSQQPSLLPTTQTSLLPTPQIPSFVPTIIPSSQQTTSATTNSPTTSPTAAATLLTKTSCPVASFPPSTQASIKPSCHVTLPPVPMPPKSLPSQTPSYFPSTSQSKFPTITPSFHSSEPSTVQPTSTSVAPSLHPTRVSIRGVIKLTISSQILLSATDYQRFLSIKLNRSPTSTLKVVPILHNANNSSMIFQSHGLIFPEDITIYPNTTSLVFNVAFTTKSLAAGNYSLQILLEQTPSTEFSLTYTEGIQLNEDNNIPIQIRSLLQPILAPKLSSALLSFDGNSLTILFESATDRGGKAQSWFTCSDLFIFPCSASASCKWTTADDGSSKAVTALVSGKTACVKPNDLLFLASSAHIKAACSSTCNTQLETANTTLTITYQSGADENPLAPSFDLQVPSTSSSCSDISIDLSQSSGDGGRSWKQVNFAISSGSNGYNLSKAQGILDQASRSKALLVTLAAGSLPSSDQPYQLQVSLCNYLGGCSTNTKNITIVTDSSVNVNILGASQVSIRAKDGLTLTGKAQTIVCGNNGSLSSYSMSISWMVTYRNGSTVSNTPLLSQSTSQDTSFSRFVLPAYSLKSGTIYQILLQAALTSSSAAKLSSSQATISVQVRSGDVVAVVNGASNPRTIAVNIGAVITLDASQSYDEDAPKSVGSAAGLSFIWSCLQVYPTLASSCSSLFSLTSKNSKKDGSLASASVVLNASSSTQMLNNLVGSKAQISLTVSDASQTRSSTLLLYIAMSNVSISLTPTTSSSYAIITNQQLYLQASVILPPGLQSGVVKWSVDGMNDKELASRALSSTSQSILTASGTTATTLVQYFSLKSNVLSAGSQYAFRVSYLSNDGFTSQAAELTIQVNQAPQPGFFDISPSSGQELTQSFTFACSGWSDLSTSLPILYQFSFQSVDQNLLSIQSKSQVSYVLFYLPAGAKNANYTITGIVEVSNVLGASTTSQDIVLVEESKQMSSTTNISTYIRDLLQNISSSNQLNGLSQALAVGSSLLNRVDCSGVSDAYCAARHRRSCSQTRNTCGTCLTEAGYSLGDLGDSNNPCFSSLDSSKNNSQSSPKLCPGDQCSGHGECIYYSYVTSLRVTTCTETAVDCYSKCECQEGYKTGSPTCDVTEAENRQRSVARAGLLDALLNNIGDSINATSIAASGSVQSSSISSEQISTWSNQLQSMTSQVQELSSDSSSKVISNINIILALANQVEVSSSTLQQLLQVVDKLATVSSSYHQQLATAAKLYSSQITSKMQPNDYARDLTLDSLQIHITTTNLSSLQSGNTTLDFPLPQSSIEQLLDKEQARMSLTLPSSSSNALLQAGITRTKANQYTFLSTNASSVLSDGLQLSLSKIACATEQKICMSSLVMTIPRSNYSVQSPMGKQEAERFNLTCKQGQTGVLHYQCPLTGDNSSALYSLQCDGKSKRLVGSCPTREHLPSCNQLSSTSTATEGCQIQHYTINNITCNCTVRWDNPAYSGKTRRLTNSSSSTDDDDDETVRISYVAMLTTVTSSVQTTILSAQNLNASSLEHGWYALTLLGSLLVTVIIAMIFSYNADFKQREEAQKQKRRMLWRKVLITPDVAGPDPLNIDPEQDLTPRRSVPSHSKVMSTFSSILTQNRQSSSLNQDQEQQQMNSALKLAEEALPEVFKSQSMQKKVSEEMKNHHRWFAVIFHYSEDFPRLLRVTALVCNMLIVLFVQSLTYDLGRGNQDDGSCQKLDTRTSCLAPSSSYASSQSKCYWESTSDTTGSCHFVEPENRLEIVLFIAIFSAIVSIPISFAEDWLLRHVISAKTIKKFAVEPSPQEEARARNISIIPALTRSNASSGLQRKRWASSVLLNKLSSTAGNQLNELQREIIEYRTTLTVIQRQEFDLLWGLDDQGHILTQKQHKTFLAYFYSRFVRNQLEDTQNERALILSDLVDINTRMERERSEIFENPVIKLEKRSKRLIFLFQRDLLPGITGLVLDNKANRDTLQPQRKVAWEYQCLAWIVIGLINGGMFFYVLLFAIAQDSHRQRAWVQGFMIWLGIEILLVSSLSVLVLHIILPALVMKDVHEIKEKVLNSVESYYQQIHDRTASNDAVALPSPPQTFNAAKYLFLSYRLAEIYASQLKIARILLQYQTPWPRQSYQHSHDVSKSYNRNLSNLTRSITLILIFLVSSFLTMPIKLQDTLSHLLSTALSGYLLLLHIQLFNLHPFLLVIPPLLLVLLGCLLFYLLKKKEDTRKTSLLSRSANIHNKYHHLDKEMQVKEEAEKMKLKSMKVEDKLLQLQRGKEMDEVGEKKEDLSNIGMRTKHVNRKQSVQHGVQIMKIMQHALVGTSSILQEEEEEQENSMKFLHKGKMMSLQDEDNDSSEEIDSDFFNSDDIEEEDFLELEEEDEEGRERAESDDAYNVYFHQSSSDGSIDISPTTAAVKVDQSSDSKRPPPHHHHRSNREEEEDDGEVSSSSNNNSDGEDHSELQEGAIIDQLHQPRNHNNHHNHNKDNNKSTPKSEEEVVLPYSPKRSTSNEIQLQAY